jgi:hypothetical protein
MKDDNTLPPGVRPVEDQTSDAYRDDRAEPLEADGTFSVRAPEMIGTQCQVQHPLSAGKGHELRPGILGVGAVDSPVGPVVIVNLIHADGSSLAAILTREDYLAFGDDFVAVGGKLGMSVTMEEEVDRFTRADLSPHLDSDRSHVANMAEAERVEISTFLKGRLGSLQTAAPDEIQDGEARAFYAGSLMGVLGIAMILGLSEEDLEAGFKLAKEGARLHLQAAEMEAEAPGSGTPH